MGGCQGRFEVSNPTPTRHPTSHAQCGAQARDALGFRSLDPKPRENSTARRPNIQRQTHQQQEATTSSRQTTLQAWRHTAVPAQLQETLLCPADGVTAVAGATAAPRTNKCAAGDNGSSKPHSYCTCTAKHNRLTQHNTAGGRGAQVCRMVKHAGQCPERLDPESWEHF